LTSWSPPAQWGHVGLGPGFVDEHQPARINSILIFAPLLTPSRDGGPILLACEYRFF
jgi:hypothetical protein